MRGEVVHPPFTPREGDRIPGAQRHDHAFGLSAVADIVSRAAISDSPVPTLVSRR